jgi:hypothetical protein
MQHDLTHLDLVALLGLYNKEINNLKTKLLNGENWEDLKDHRRIVTELAAAIHKKEPQLSLLNLAELNKGKRMEEFPEA